MKTRPIFAPLLALLATCTAEVTSHCPSYQTISHSYTLNSTGEDLMQEKMDSITVLQFGPTGLFQGEIFIPSPKNEQPVEVEIQGSQNTLLSVGGEHFGFHILDRTTGTSPIVGTTQLSDIEFHLLNIEQIAQPTSQLYLSEPTAVAGSGLSGGHTEIPLIDKTKILTLHLLGGSDTHSATLMMGNTALDYTGYPIADAQMVQHLAQRTVGADTVTFTFDIIRLFETDSTGTLVIDPNGLQSAPALSSKALGGSRTTSSTTEISLVSTIMQNPDLSTQDALDRQEGYTLVVDATRDVAVVVAVNDWVIVNVEPF